MNIYYFGKALTTILIIAIGTYYGNCAIGIQGIVDDEDSVCNSILKILPLNMVIINTSKATENISFVPNPIESYDAAFAQVSHYYLYRKLPLEGSNVMKDGLIRLPLESIPPEYLTQTSFEKGILNVGNNRSSSLHALYEKLAVSNKCTQITVLGGSISCAATVNALRLNSPRFRVDSYAAKLQTLLNEHFPNCKAVLDGPTEHEVANICNGGSGTSHWIDVAAHHKVQHKSVLRRSDLIIVETSVNDYEYQHKLRAQTELLLHIFSSLRGSTKDRMAMMWIGLSSLSLQPWKERGDSIEDQVDVMRAYGIPHYSMMDAFLPFDTDIKKYWFLDIYKGDAKTHLSRFGHDVAAAYLFTFMKHIFDHLDKSSAVRYELHPSALAYANKNEIDLYTTVIPYTVNLYTSEESHGFCKAEAVGFRKTADVRNKYGLIATTIGSHAAILLPMFHEDSSPYQYLKVEYLASYEGMGTMQLVLTTCDDSCTDKTGIEILKVTVDSLDVSNRVSISKSALYKFNISQANTSKYRKNKPRFYFRKEKTSCKQMKLTVSVVSSSNPRSDNKIKLFSVTLY